jgi:hypothetical protein
MEKSFFIDFCQIFEKKLKIRHLGLYRHFERFSKTVFYKILVLLSTTKRWTTECLRQKTGIFDPPLYLRHLEFFAKISTESSLGAENFTFHIISCQKVLKLIKNSKSRTYHQLVPFGFRITLLPLHLFSDTLIFFLMNNRCLLKCFVIPHFLGFKNIEKVSP